MGIHSKCLRDSRSVAHYVCCKLDVEAPDNAGLRNVCYGKVERPITTSDWAVRIGVARGRFRRRAGLVSCDGN